MFEGIDVFGQNTARAVFAKIYGLTEKEDDDPIIGVDRLIDALPDKKSFYNCYTALIPQLEPVQKRFGHAEMISSVCEYYGLEEPMDNPFTEEKLRMKYSPDEEGFDGTGKGCAQDIDYAFENSMTEFGQALRQEVLDNASQEARERLHDLDYEPIVIADASKQSSKEWHDSRVVGGSSLSSLTGTSPYRNAYDEYMHITGAEVLIEESEEKAKKQQYIFDFGHQAEKWIAQAIEVLDCLSEFRGCKVLVDTRVFSFEEREDFFSVNLDGILQWPDGHYSIAEFKAPGYYSKKDYENNSVPAYYQDQVQGQMLTTNIDDAYLFAFFSRDEVTASRVVRDLDYQCDLLDVVDDFWYNHVQAGIEPPNEGNGEMVVKLDRKYNGKRDNKLPQVQLDASLYLDAIREASELDIQRMQLEAEAKNLKKQRDNLIAPVLVSMGHSSYGVLEDGNDRYFVRYTETEDTAKLVKKNMDRLSKDDPLLFQQLKPYLTYSGGGARLKLEHTKKI